MAEVGLVASLLGIASFGIQLTTTLYKVGSTASCARDQTDYVARHITLYSDILELLAQKIDDDEPIHSRKALDLVGEIYDQSCDLFDKIEDLLPDRADKLSFLEKIKWNFKKPKVDLLVTEIEYLKSTVNLLIGVLYAGKKIRTCKRKKQSETAQKSAQAQYARAQNAIVEQVNATATKEKMQAKVEEDERNASKEAADQNIHRVSSAVIKHTPQIPLLVNNTAMVHFKQSLGQANTLSEERALVMHNSVDLLEDLLDQWTTLAQDATTNNVDGPNHAIQNAAGEAISRVSMGTTKKSPDMPNPSAHLEPEGSKRKKAPTIIEEQDRRLKEHEEETRGYLEIALERSAHQPVGRSHSPVQLHQVTDFSLKSPKIQIDDPRNDDDDDDVESTAARHPRPHSPETADQYEMRASDQLIEDAVECRGKGGIPYNIVRDCLGEWTDVKRRYVSPDSLKREGKDFVEVGDYVSIRGKLGPADVEWLAEDTSRIRGNGLALGLVDSRS